MGGGLGGVPTLLDVCSFLGMGREERVGKKGKGVGLGARFVVGRLSAGLVSCSLDGKMG